MRSVALIQLMTVAGLILGGCVRDPFVTERGETRSGEWWIPHQIDRVTDAALPSAYVFAEASNSNVDFPRVSSMQLTCMNGAPLIRFAFDFKIGSNRNTILGYRFDGKPGHDNVGSRIVRGNQIIVIEDRAEIASFVRELAGATTLYVRIRSINGGRTAVEYPLDGSAAAIRAAFAKCDVPQPPLPEQGRTTLLGVY
ncbi:hypothetical protein [Tardiphaga sp. P9-11]|uniref:hypothetical protein n=1 Tax=Tardiphaga sp. P9-11 TaxID=2024614 RepID=UPI001FED9D83|nr:hypothetical protein [Tardiphaga sp. P9-11]